MGSTSDMNREERDVELEDQFILRLPLEQAKLVRTALSALKSKRFKKFLSIALDTSKKDVRSGIVRVKKQELKGQLVDLPCIVESYKTIDGIRIFKTADISQMLVCSEDEPDKEEGAADVGDSSAKSAGYLHPHGLTVPLKNVRKQRLRKILKNKEDLEEVAEIEKEVLWLLRADNEAVSTRYEIFYEEPDRAEDITERTIFGEIISDSEYEGDTPSSSSKSSASELIENEKTSSN